MHHKCTTEIEIMVLVPVKYKKHFLLIFPSMQGKVMHSQSFCLCHNFLLHRGRRLFGKRSGHRRVQQGVPETPAPI